jgi:hypothetical protein
MPERALPTEQILSLLAEAPPRLAALTDGLPPERLRAAPGPDKWSAGADEWSANDVLAHMRACADMWGDAIETILAHDRPTIRAVNPRTWIRQTDYLELEFRPSLDAFTGQRAALLAVLEPLPPEDWRREATVTGAGKPLVRTVHAYAQWLATHERPHVKQIARIVGRGL